MKDILDKLMAEGGPLRVRALIAFGIIAPYIYLAVKGKIAPEDVVATVVIVLGFYFITRAKS